MKFLSMKLFKNRLSLIFYFAILNIKLRYKSTYLGFIWSAFEPLLYFTVLYVVFTGIRDRDPLFPISLITGILFFHLFTRILLITVVGKERDYGIHFSGRKYLLLKIHNLSEFYSTLERNNLSQNDFLTI